MTIAERIYNFRWSLLCKLFGRSNQAELWFTIWSLPEHAWLRILLPKRAAKPRIAPIHFPAAFSDPKFMRVARKSTKEMLEKHSFLMPCDDDLNKIVAEETASKPTEPQPPCTT